MIDHEISPRDALHLLSVRDDHASGHSRRRFLQMIGMGLGGGALLTGLGGDGFAELRRAWASVPLAPTDGILVLIGMYGGNDGLNTIVPFASPEYYQYRSNINIPAGSVLPINDQIGFNPRLTALKALWDDQKVAIVQGVGYPNPNLSHFDSMATWMAGSAPGHPPSSGWIGRWLDGYGAPADHFSVASVNSSLALHLVGQSRRGTTIPENGFNFGGAAEGNDLRMYDAVFAFSAASSGRGAWQDTYALAQRSQIEVAQSVAPLFTAEMPSSRLARRLTVAARLINADIGMRVLDAGLDSFDHHSGEPNEHGDLMTELNLGIKTFFETISPEFRSRVTIMTFSEFGRTPWSNGSQGTDHGTAAPHLVIGDRVLGGVYGDAPSMRKPNGALFSEWDRLTATTDFRSLYATILEGVLAGDADSILRGHFDRIDLFRPIPVDSTPEVPPTTMPVTPPLSLPPEVTSPPVLIPDFTTPPAEIVPADVPAQPQGEPAAGAGFHGITPVRLLDTREAGQHALGAASSLSLAVAGRAGIPSEAVAAVLNVTAVGPTGPSYLTVWPTGTARPATSSLNMLGGDIVPNLVISKLGANGSVDIYNNAGLVDCVVDVFGYFAGADGDRFTALSPARILDSRAGIGVRPGAVGQRAAIDLAVAGVGGAPANATAVIMNVTATGPSDAGYVTVWPSGETMPTASNVNFTRGETVPNLVISKLGRDGKVSLFNSSGSTDLVADVLGYFSPAGTAGLVPLDPARVLDTRSDGPSTPVGQAPLSLPILGRGGVPTSGVSAVVLNITATDGSAPSYVTVFPGGEPQPTASNLNLVAGQTRANLVVCKVGPDGGVALFNSSGTVHLIADVVGYLTA